MATAVMHGRRKGQARGTPEIPSLMQQGMMLPDGTDLRQVTVLSKVDWERINKQLNRKQIEHEHMSKMRFEQESLKAKSREMVKNWGNTIAGQRQSKLEARKLREEKEEAERVEVDLEEAKFQAKQRKEAIEKAKTQQYYQTDRVKSFHSALMLTEVLKERDAQLELKVLKEKASEGKDREWLEHGLREYEEGVRQDQTKAIDRINAARDVADFQRSQIREHQKVHWQEKEEDLKEGCGLKKLSMQYQIEKERLESIRRDEKKELMTDNRKQIEETKIMKKLKVDQEEEEDEECRVFAAAKRKMMRLRAEKEKNIYEEKQKQLEKIREKLTAQMKQKTDDEAGRIGIAVEEAEEKRKREEIEKEKKLKKMIQESAEHRHKQMKEAAIKKKEERRQELEMMRIREAADEIFQRNEEEKRVRKREEARGLMNFHVKQGTDKLSKIDKEKEEMAKIDRANFELLAHEETQFQEYASKVIEHCEEGGRNVYPLKKAAVAGVGGGAGPVFHEKGGIRPSYMVNDKSGKQMPHYQKDSTNDIKETINGKAPSKKRLGFVW
ncbi:hypothetical protein ScPMuIL_016591 [Solemya velum]